MDNCDVVIYLKGTEKTTDKMCDALEWRGSIVIGNGIYDVNYMPMKEGIAVWCQTAWSATSSLVDCSEYIREPKNGAERVNMPEACKMFGIEAAEIFSWDTNFEFSEHYIIRDGKIHSFDVASCREYSTDEIREEAKRFLKGKLGRTEHEAERMAEDMTGNSRYLNDLAEWLEISADVLQNALDCDDDSCFTSGFDGKPTVF